MNEKFEQLLAEFNERKENLEINEKLYNSLKSRLFDAKKVLSELDQEKIEIREQRPTLLADGENVDKLNKRLKEIEEEIELKEDEVKGIQNKLPVLRQDLKTMCSNTNVVYSQVVAYKIPDLYADYNKVAQKLAEKVKEYCVLKNMSQDYYSSSHWAYSEKFPGALSLIPSLPKDDKPIFDKNNYDSSGIGEKLRKRFDIPEYAYRNQEIYR